MRHKDPQKMQMIIGFVDQFFMEYKETPSTGEIARRLHMDQGNVYRYITEMRDKGMITYDGEMIGTPAVQKHMRGGAIAAHVGSIRCGTPEFEEQDIDAYYTLPEAIFGKGEFYILTAKGDSMIEAGIEEGDLVVVRKTQEAQKGDIVVALLNGENTLKRLKISRGKYSLHPENSSMEDIPVGKEDEFYIQGVATHIIKKVPSSLDKPK